MSRVLVLGANGFLGLNIVEALRAKNVEVVAGRRKRSNVLPLRSRKVSMVELDLDLGESLVAAMRGFEVVVHAAGHYPRLSIDRERTLAIGQRQIENVLNAAAESRVQRLVYVSSTATVAPAPEGRSNESHTFRAPPGFGVYHDLKWRMEDRASKEDRLEVLTLCPAGCLGPWDLRVGTSASLVALARGLAVPHPDGWVSIVDARDVAEAVVRMVGDSAPPGRLLLSGGSYRLHSLLQDLAPRYGQPPPRPLLTEAEAVALADKEEQRCAREGGRAALSREIVDLVVHGAPIDASLAERRLGLSYRSLAETLDTFDEWARRMRIIPAAQPEAIS